nr:D-alanyl-D-alanine carboxypeptidase/D-alanyl-D-alanine-endopeptidase [Corynebacterium mendelii]
MTAELDRLATSDGAGQLSGAVVAVDSGQMVWSHGGQPLRPASVTKLLTGAAALRVLGPDHRVDTTVVAGDRPDTVVMVAGGDVMLDQARLDDLAAQVIAARGQGTVTRVLVDTGVWSDNDFASGWHAEDVPGGYIAPMQPVMVHGGRIGGDSGDLPRSAAPALDAAAALATRLGAGDTGFGGSPEQAEVLARVHSAPLVERLGAIMQHSDNVMAEALGREIAVARGVQRPDSAAAARAVIDVLAGMGVDTTGVVLADTCGLSDDNRIPPATLTGVLVQAVESPPLTPLVGTLPISNATGTLAGRYADTPAKGFVRAKTGTLLETSALAGTVTSRGGVVYVFALLSNGTPPFAARPVLDRMAAAVQG